MAGVLRNSSTARCICGPATIATELVSPGFWRKAMPNPTASSSGKTNTQNMTSGSRHISVKRVFTNCRKAIQRALPRGPAVGAGFGVVLGTAGWVSVAMAKYEVRVTKYDFCEVRFTNCELRITNCELHFVNRTSYF